MRLFSCCRGCEDSVVAPTGRGGKRDLLIPVDEETKNVESTKSSPAEENLDDTVDEMLDVPDLDDLENKTGGANTSSSTEGIYAFAEEERGVTVMIFNFLMVLLGLSHVSKNAKRKAITNGTSK